MRIAIVSTPFVRVPPRSYGGTELVVDALVRGLARAGHDVTLFATGDSRAPDVRYIYDEPIWPPDEEAEQVHCDESAGAIAREQFDVVHAHTPGMLRHAAAAGAPFVYTIHHARDEELARLYRGHPEVRYVAISRRQAELHPELRCEVVHHGLDPDRYPLGRGERDDAVFLGRLVPAKGPEDAIAAARAAGLGIRLAGIVHDAEVTPAWRSRLEDALRGPGVEYVGKVSGGPKVRFLGSARALLMPVHWEEPFGLVMIEAMLCGTPVIAFPGGATAEVVDDGVTGLLVGDRGEMASVLAMFAHFDRAACRRRAVERFSATRMVRAYERLFARAVAEGAIADGWARPSSPR